MFFVVNFFPCNIQLTEPGLRNFKQIFVPRQVGNFTAFLLIKAFI
jgi:hypothetical protein